MLVILMAFSLTSLVACGDKYKERVIVVNNEREKDKNSYTSDSKDTYRYYFYMPDEWHNRG